MGKPDRIRYAALAGGALYALLAAFGFQAEHYGESFPLPALLAASLLFPLFALLLDRLFRREEDRALSVGGKPFSARRVFLLIFLCRLPAFAVLYPGSFAYDVPFQLEQIATGAYSTHHPLVHTLLLGSCVQLGRLFGNVNLGAALYTVLQVLLLSLLNALCCGSLFRQAGSRAARGAALFFALYPVHLLMAVNATKDVLFSGCFALALTLLREWLCGGALPEKRRALLFIATAGAVLLRNNMAYALFAFLLCLLAAKRRRVAAFMACALAAGFLFSQGLAAFLHAVPGDLRETLSWPIQQLARISVREREKLTEEEKGLIDGILPQMAWKNYDPTVSDPVKFEFRTEKFKEDPGKYAKLCLGLLARCPKCSLDAVLMLTHAYLYPYRTYGVSGRYLQTGVTDVIYTGWKEEETITDESPFPALRNAIDWRFGAQGAMQIPVVGWFFNLGLLMWLTVYAVLRAFAVGKPGEGLAGLWPLLLLGSFLPGPVMAGRYAYAFFSALPVLLARVRNR
ncbi:MAG: DUF6020 family protein [Clostridiales bacterium]|nr:DUF6020 family protein [Clostridiales bacterium]